MFICYKVSLTSPYGKIKPGFSLLPHSKLPSVPLSFHPSLSKTGRATEPSTEDPALHIIIYIRGSRYHHAQNRPL